MSFNRPRFRRALLALGAAFGSATAVCALPTTLQDVAAEVKIENDGALVFITLDPADGPRFVYITAAGPGLKQYQVANTLADPKIEVWNSAGTMVASNDDRPDQFLSDVRYPMPARDPKDAAVRMMIYPGVTTVRVTGVAGSTGTCLIEVTDLNSFPSFSSFAVLGRTMDQGNIATLGTQLFTYGNVHLAWFVTGPNLPVSNPVQDPKFTISSGTTILPTNTYITSGVPSLMPRYGSPVMGDGRNAGHAALWTFDSSNNPPVVQIGDEAGGTNGMFLFEIHNNDITTARPGVAYVPPRDTTVTEGDPLQLQALIGGIISGAVWQRDGIDIPASSGLVSASSYNLLTLKLPTTTAADAGTYRVKLSTASGAAYSLPATVSVRVIPAAITVVPAPVTAYAGSGATFSITATGTGLAYQWYKDGAAISGATAATFSLPSITAADAGNYTVLVGNTLGSMLSSPAMLTVLPVPTRIINLSVRSNAGLGARTLIAGFTVDGGTKPLVVRGVGPTLAQWGVPDLLADPHLTVYRDQIPITENENWTTDDGRSLGAFPLPAGSNDAVIKRSYDSGTYSAQVTSAAGATGNALVEVYDGNPAPSAARIINVSSRTQVDNGQRLIVGFILEGNDPKPMILRAVGPKLAAYGVAGAHPDPRIELYRGSDLVATNDDWSGDDGRGSGAFPLDPGSKDAVLIRSLQPGNYSIHILGAAGTSGIVLGEIYEVRE